MDDRIPARNGGSYRIRRLPGNKPLVSIRRNKAVIVFHADDFTDVANHIIDLIEQDQP